MKRLQIVTQKEYELRYAGKMCKVDLLADGDGTFAVPLQIEKTYNGDRGRVYIIVSINNVDFISDYGEIDDVRYYFLKIPYQMSRLQNRLFCIGSCKVSCPTGYEIAFFNGCSCKI